MSEWWTYRLSDFLLFSERTYRRLFELYNADVWPGGHGVAVAAGLLIALLAPQGRARAVSVACTLMALCWGWVAWAFHWQRYATINWAAVWFAGAFAVQALLMLWAGAVLARSGPGARQGWAGHFGAGLLWLGVLGQPWIGVLLGRPWGQVELFGLAPDPTTVATLGLLLLLPARGVGPSGLAFSWTLWVIPLLWCAVGGATLWTLEAPDALLMPCLGGLAGALAWRNRGRHSRHRSG